jgi:hypothetical protein
MADSIPILLSSVLVLLVLWIVFERWRARLPTRRRVLVALVHDDSFALDGILWAAPGAYLVLKGAALVKADGSRTPMDGELLIERKQLAWLQYLPPNAS